MKIIFLDIDGVLNCKDTVQRQTRYPSIIGIDPYKAILLDRIVLATGAKIVISSSWRHWPDSMTEIRRAVDPEHIIDVTPSLQSTRVRGFEIKKWLTEHSVTKYAILDDDSDMLAEQWSHFFKTTWERGLTEEIAQQVIDHLNS